MATTMTITETSVISTSFSVPTSEDVARRFPDVNTTVIGGSHASATADNTLEGYDEEQIRLMDEVCIVLDEHDLPIGSASKKVCEYPSSVAELRQPGL